MTAANGPVDITGNAPAATAPVASTPPATSGRPQPATPRRPHRTKKHRARRAERALPLRIFLLRKGRVTAPGAHAGRGS
jgi:hypothetical protein